MFRIICIILFLFGIPVLSQDRPRITLQTISQLSTRPPFTNEVVEVLGYSTPGDWGVPKIFRWDATNTLATNAIRIKSALAVGRYIHDWDGDVRVFGANVLNNDNADQLQAAADYALENRRVMYVPSSPDGGIYRTTREIIITNTVANQVKFGGIRGDGPGKSRIIRQNQDGPVLVLRGQYYELSGLTLGYWTNSLKTNNTASCLYLPGFQANVKVTRVQFLNGYNGILGLPDDSGNGVFTCEFTSCLIYNNVRGIDWNSGTGNVMQNIYIAAPDIPYCDFAIRDIGGGSTWNQLNIEHANHRSTPFQCRSDSTRIGLMSFEGNRIMNGDSIFATSGGVLPIDHVRLINNFWQGYGVTSITRSGTNATLTPDGMDNVRTGGHGFVVGDTIFVDGATDALYNGTKTVISVTASNLVYGMSGTPAADAVVDLAGGSDYISVNRGTSASVNSLFLTQSGGNSELLITALGLRDNRVISAKTANRNGLMVGNEANGMLGRVTVQSVQTGSPFEPGSGQTLSTINLAGSKRDGTNATLWTIQPHRLSTNDIAFFLAGTPAFLAPDFLQTSSLTNWTVLTVPTPYSFTVEHSGSATPFLRETNFGYAHPITAKVTSYSRTNNIATISTDRAHHIKRGYKIALSRMSNSSFSSLTAVALTVSSTTNLTYRSVGADVATTAESQGVIGVFDAGVSPFLQNSTHHIVKKFGAWSEQITALASNTIASGSYDLTTNFLNNAQYGDTVTLTPIDPENWNADLLVTGAILTRNNIVIQRRNIGASSITNLGGVWSVNLHRP
jgi:hypothetical protein